MSPSNPSDSEGLAPFPVRAIASVDPRPPEARWLVEPLWTADSVGLLASNPKVGKTWLAIELALAVASGCDVLGRFPARDTGPVLFYGAEDGPPDLRARFDSVAQVRGVDLAEIPLMLLDVPVLSLNRQEQLMRLSATVAELRPRLLVLDPFVRCADIDENSSSEVSSVLGSLRALQRAFDLSVVVVHHMRKASSRRLSLRLRGSSDFAAWHDSALFLTEEDDHAVLTVEHRRARAPDPVRLRLERDAPAHLHLLEDHDSATEISSGDSIQDELLDQLARSPAPRSTSSLRSSVGRRKSTVTEALNALQSSGHVERRSSGWVRVEPRLEPGEQAQLFPGSQP